MITTDERGTEAMAKPRLVGREDPAWKGARSWAERFSSLQTIAAVLVGLVVLTAGAVATAIAWANHMATKDDVRAMVAEHAQQPHQPTPAQAESEATRQRLEGELHRQQQQRLDRLQDGVDWIVRTTYSAAAKVGAKPSPPPARSSAAAADQ